MAEIRAVESIFDVKMKLPSGIVMDDQRALFPHNGEKVCPRKG